MTDHYGNLGGCYECRELSVDEHEDGARVGKQVRRLGGGEADATASAGKGGQRSLSCPTIQTGQDVLDRDDDRSDGRHSLESVCDPGAVRTGDEDAVAPLDAGGEERVGEVEYPDGPLAVGPLDIGFRVRDGDVGRADRGCLEQERERVQRRVGRRQ